MKIAIVGAMGVGKTTLANDLSDVLDIKILPEIARKMIEEGYKLDKDVTPAIELEILKRQVALEETEEYFIADRGVIDVMAYSSVLFHDDMFLLNKINNQLCVTKYDIVFYIPIEFPLEGDGIRSEDIKFQKRIDQEIRFTIEAFNWHKIKGDRDQRIKKAVKIIDNYYTSKELDK